MISTVFQDRRARLTLLLVSAFFWARPAVAWELPYDTRSVAGILADAAAVVAADFDMDGDEDLAAVSETGDEVIWLEWTGTGFTRHVITATLDGPADLASGDLDCDGDLDLAIAVRGAGSVFWAENMGGGSWGSGGTISASASGVSSVAVGDVDDSGSPDVVAAVTGADSVELYRNTGCDGVGWLLNTVSSALTGVADVVLADVTRDGLLDVLAAAETSGEVVFFENTGSGIWSLSSVGLFPGARSLAAGDLDGDGDADVAAASSLATAWWANPGSPNWPEGPLGPMGATDVQVTDLDRDGDLDVLAGGGAGAGAVGWWDNTQGDGSAWEHRSVDGGAVALGGLVAMDLGGDGDRDIAAAIRDLGQVAIHENVSSHRGADFPEEKVVPFPFPLRDIPELTSGDLDGDGDPDLALIDRDVGQAEAIVSWYENVGTNTLGQLSFVGPGNMHFINAATFESLVLGDLDGDGDADAFIGGANTVVESATFCRNDGALPAVWWPCFGVDSGSLLNVDAEAVADLDNDGDLDVLAVVEESATGADFVIWWENDGDPTQSSGWIRHDIDMAGPSKLLAADLDADGMMDVLASGGAWWRNAGGGPPTWVTESIPGLQGPPSVGDIDQDGDLDVAGVRWDVIDGVSLAWFENDLPNIATPWTAHTVWVPPPATDIGSQASVLADVDLDGDLDLLSGLTGSGNARLSWLENDVAAGSGPWVEHELEPQFYTPALLEVRDFDRDGDPDMVTSPGENYFDGWTNTGGQYGVGTFDVAPPTITAGLAQAVLRLEVFHRGRTGENDLELAELALLFEETPGDPLSQTEFDDLVASVRLFQDDGSGIFEAAQDTEVASFSSLVLTAGAVALQLPDDIAELRHAPQDTPGVYFLALELALTATSTGILEMVVTHTFGLGTVAQDADHDLPLSPEWRADGSAAFLVIEFGLFSDGFESGDTAAWSSTVN